MAYQQSGRRQPSQFNQFQGSPTLQSQYGAPSPPGIRGANPFVRRTPSFDPGDDAPYPEDINGMAEQSRGYRPGSNASIQHDELHMGTQGFPPRSTSYSTAHGGGYQHQDATVAQSRSSYNPQQYGAPQQQYSPQLTSPTVTSFNSAPQPYIPAAYQTASTQYQPSYGGQGRGTPPQAYPATTPALPSIQSPPPPPRPHEQRYGSRVSPYIGSESKPQPTNTYFEQSYQPQASFSNPQSPPGGPVYTPPAPPPPPFSPSQDAYSSTTSFAAPSHSYSQRAGASQSLQQRAAGRPPSIHSSLPPVPTYNPSASPRNPSPVVQRRPVGSNASLASSSLPPTPGTPGPTPPAHSPQRTDTVGRHPQARPLPGPPAPQADYFGVSNGQNDEQEESDAEPGYDDLMQEVEAAVMGRPPPTSSRPNPRARSPDHGSTEENQPTLFPYPGDDPDSDHIHTNGHVGEIAKGQYVNYDPYSDKSDAEAEAGLAAMHIADEQDAADEARRLSGQSQQTSKYHDQLGGVSSDSDVAFDMDTYGGGFPGNIHYGDQESSLGEGYGYANSVDDQGRPFAATRTSQRSDISSTLYDYPIPGQEYIHPFAPARVDRAGTGGLSEPRARERRLSFEDGDEATLAESEEAYTSGTQSPSRDNMPDMFFHPGAGPNRPLPAAPVEAQNRGSVPQLMPAGTYHHPERLLQYNQYGRPTYPVAPDAYNTLLSPQGTPVPRSSSLRDHISTPQMVPPIRSKTDADRARILKQQQLGLRSTSVYGADSLGDPSVNPSAELVGLLPEIPSGKRRKFNPSKLSTNDFIKCPEPWALSSITAWIKEMSEGEADLREQAIVDGIVALFTHKVPTMNTADAEVLGAKVVRSMFDAGVLLKEEEWVKFGTASMSGVLFQLTGTGCYSPKVHTQAMPGRCYAHHCMRTLKKINLQTQVLEPQRKEEDWATFYKLTKSDIEKFDKKEIERQNNLHEIVTTEDKYIDQLNVLRVLYRDELAKWQPPILAPKRKDSFLRDVFGRADSIKKVNEDYLLAQLKYRQQEQGPWIVGFSDIFREWIRKAKSAYIDYAANFPNANFLIRQESERNLLFQQFLNQARNNERSERLSWDTFLKAPITRLQRYSLLLSTVHKHMMQDSEEKTNLQAAIDEIKIVTMECDVRVAEMSKNVDLSELQAKLQLRPDMQDIALNLTHLGRELIFQGDVQRPGSAKLSWVDTRAILFDHYLVLTKIITARDAAGGLKYEKYDVSKRPIPMDLLVLESTNDEPVVKTAVKGFGTVTTATTKANTTPQEIRKSRESMSNSQGGPGTLAHMNTASSASSITTNGTSKTLVASTVIDSSKDERVMYPFRIKNLGSESYTLYAPSSENREMWCAKIIEAKTRHAASLNKQNAEPFRLRVIADTAFGYDAMSGTGKSILIKGTPLDRAIREVEKKYKDMTVRPNPVCRAAVNCATAFNQPYGKPMVAVGTDYGVFISSYDNPRGWTRVSSTPPLPFQADTNLSLPGHSHPTRNPNRRPRRILPLPPHSR